LKKEKVTAKFMFDRIKFVQTTFYWSVATTAQNFKLALRNQAAGWLNRR
jgi:hypothetical protein